MTHAMANALNVTKEKPAKKAPAKKGPKPTTMPKKLKTKASRIIKFDDVTAQAWIDQDREIRDKLKVDNRPVTNSNVKAKAEDMFNESYMCTSQGPTVDWDGKVIDGQHGLLAVILYYVMCADAGVKATPVEMYVTEGDDPANFPFYDLGKSRTGADVFAIEKVTNPKEYAYAVRLVWIRVNGKRVAGAGRLSPYALMEFAKEHKGLKSSLKYIMEFGKEEESLPCNALMSPGYAAALHYLMVNADGVKDAKKVADDFWNDVIEREGKKDSGAYKFQRKLVKVKTDPNLTMNRDAIVDYAILAFNNQVEGITKNFPREINKEDRQYLGGYDAMNVEEEDE